MQLRGKRLLDLFVQGTSTFAKKKSAAQSLASQLHGHG
jgi:hypothetical protein